jgi:murein DD-endopeptidase MepM/ murein hydrolase activator NlpD
VDRYRDLTPHEAYLVSLDEAGLGETALARSWRESARRALESPLGVDLPFQEEGFIAPDEAGAVGYRFSLDRGQVLTIASRVRSPDSTRVFVDLFRVPDDPEGPLRPVQSADTVAGDLVYEPYRGGEYVLRLQPELLRGGRYRVALTLRAALAFPVEGRDEGAILSFFGAARDGGRREHHGVDIFAPRGTPVLASTEGQVRRANVTNLGGKVVWLRDSRRNQSIYYAHLDSQTVSRGDRVEVGDTLGFVGNTGNAITTPPHLHYGIYRRGEGPIDPLPFIRRPPGPVPDLTADLAALGEWARIPRGGIRLRSGPASRARVLAELDRHTPFRVRGGAGSWYRVQLPDGREGWLAARLTEGLDEPVEERVAQAPGDLRSGPEPDAPVVGPVEAGASLQALARYGPYLLVRDEAGRRGWWAVPADG